MTSVEQLIREIAVVPEGDAAEMTDLAAVRAMLDAAIDHDSASRRSPAGRERGRMAALRAIPLVLASVGALLIVVVALTVLRPHSSSGTHPASAGLTRLQSVLGVLRQGQTSADRGFRSMVLPLPRNTARSDIDPLWSEVRLATVTPWGAKVFLVPLRPKNPLVARQRPLDVATWVQGIGWSDYSSPSDITNGNDWGPGATTRLANGRTVNRFFEVVPDGVAKVVYYEAHFTTPVSRPTIVGHLTAIVHNNIAVFQQSKIGSPIVLAAWYAADGGLIKRIGNFGKRGGDRERLIRELSRAGRQQLIDILAVLRRPQTYADLHSHTIAEILKRPRGSTFGQGPIDRPLVRLLGTTPWRVPVYLIPYEPAPTGQPGSAPLGQRPSRTEGIWLESQGGSCCYTAADIGNGKAIDEGGFGPLNGPSQTRLIMLVPDGVSRVEFRFHTPSVRRTVNVHNNIAAAEFQRPCCHGLERTIWYAANGQVVPQRAP
jgi:hypothetical protein